MSFSGMVNGVKVYSDKEMRSVVNDVITFSDGSHCNVTTRSVFNNGPGYICFDVPPGSDCASGKVETIGPRSFVAQSLRLSRLSDVAVIIEPHPSNMIEVTVEGPAGLAKSIKCNELPYDCLHVYGRDGGSSGGNVSISNVTVGSCGRRSRPSRVDIGGGVRIHGLDMESMFGSGRGGQTIVQSGSGDSLLKIDIKVPEKTPIDIRRVNGQVVIGDTHGNLRVDIGGVGEITAGIINTADLEVSGSGEIHIARVSQRLEAQVSGTGEVEVESGQVDNLRARVNGTGSLRFGGSAVDARLRVSGVGSINVREVTGELDHYISGVGSIDVANRRR